MKQILLCYLRCKEIICRLAACMSCPRSCIGLKCVHRSLSFLFMYQAQQQIERIENITQMPRFSVPGRQTTLCIETVLGISCNVHRVPPPMPRFSVPRRQITSCVESILQTSCNVHRVRKIARSWTDAHLMTSCNQVRGDEFQCVNVLCTWKVRCKSVGHKYVVMEASHARLLLT